MMNCHMCGQREATIHLFELIDGHQTSVWLCDICASGRPELVAGNLGTPFPLVSGQTSNESGSLASFLGQSTDGEGGPSRVSACPHCEYQLSEFQNSNRLGCVRCYEHFREQVQPILGMYHRHVSHLGKVPHSVSGTASRQGELTRMRVALEKAIQTENYEEAARLRDLITQLKEKTGALKNRSSDE